MSYKSCGGSESTLKTTALGPLWWTPKCALTTFEGGSLLNAEVQDVILSGFEGDRVSSLRVLGSGWVQLG